MTIDAALLAAFLEPAGAAGLQALLAAVAGGGAPAAPAAPSPGVVANAAGGARAAPAAPLRYASVLRDTTNFLVGDVAEVVSTTANHIVLAGTGSAFGRVERLRLSITQPCAAPAAPAAVGGAVESSEDDGLEAAPAGKRAAAAHAASSGDGGSSDGEFPRKHGDPDDDDL